MRKREEREGGREGGRNGKQEERQRPPLPHPPDLIILFNGAVYIYIYIFVLTQ